MTSSLYFCLREQVLEAKREVTELCNCLTSYWFLSKNEEDWETEMLFLKGLCWGMQWLSGRYCMKWACSARRRVRRKNFLKHPLTQKLLESLQEQIEKATAAFMLQDSIVLIFSQLYQIIHLLATHVRGKICWKATRGSAQNRSEWTWHIYAAACPILFFLFLSAPIASFISTLPSF